MTEFDFSQTGVVYEANDVTVTSFPVIHARSGAVGYRFDFAGLTFVHSGDTCAGWPLVRACEGGVDLLIHECFPPAAALAAATGLSIERATMALNAAHTSPAAAGKVFGLVRPRMAGLIHTFLSPQVIPLIFSELRAVYEGPVVQTQDLTVFNVTKDAVVARQAQVIDQLPPIAGEQRVAYTPVLPTPPDWWAEARIPLDDVVPPPRRSGSDRIMMSRRGTGRVGGRRAGDQDAARGRPRGHRVLRPLRRGARPRPHAPSPRIPNDAGAVAHGQLAARLRCCSPSASCRSRGSRSSGSSA